MVMKMQDMLKNADLAELGKYGMVSPNIDKLEKYSGTVEEYVKPYGDYYNALSDKGILTTVPPTVPTTVPPTVFPSVSRPVNGTVSPTVMETVSTTVSSAALSNLVSFALQVIAIFAFVFLV